VGNYKKTKHRQRRLLNLRSNCSYMDYRKATMTPEEKAISSEKRRKARLKMLEKLSEEDKLLWSKKKSKRMQKIFKSINGEELREFLRYKKRWSWYKKIGSPLLFQRLRIKPKYVIEKNKRKDRKKSNKANKKRFFVFNVDRVPNYCGVKTEDKK